jgi:hypothetical protein
MPISTNMETPDSREDFERNLYLLEEKIKNKKFAIATGARLAAEGLQRVRHLPNGRVDMLSIDESARLAANMCAMMDGRAKPQPESLEPKG